MFALGTPVLCTLVILAQSGWSASGGRESFSYRDVARAGPPADASPVEWTGVGPSLFVMYERTNEIRAHRFNVDVASAGSFAYEGPVRRVAAPSGDSAFRLEGRYEYRRNYFRDKFVRGLDIPLGVQGLSRRLTLEREVAGTQTFASEHSRFGRLGRRALSPLESLVRRCRVDQWHGCPVGARLVFSRCAIAGAPPWRRVAHGSLGVGSRQAGGARLVHRGVAAHERGQLRQPSQLRLLAAAFDRGGGL